VNGAKSSSAIGTTGTAEPQRPYCGRFAPSPSGELHFGSLVAAVGSYLEARARGGRWLLRIEDLDPPRERPGVTDRILTDLERLGFDWDGAVLYQSTRADAYEAAIAHLERAGLIRRCACSRSQLAALPENHNRAAGEECFHPAACIPGSAAGLPREAGFALRLRAADREIVFLDRCQGRVATNVARTVGDFVLQRRDGLHSYQLAVTVDDAEQAVTDVVRGADLLSSTPRQILLQEALGLVRPGYLHLPLAVNVHGAKLSKSADAPALAEASLSAQLAAALEFLQQDPPAELAAAPTREILGWARLHWRPERFRGMTAVRVSDEPAVGRFQEGRL
jgi:glutamyl-Q tRNA(Asp) synthetase